MNKTSPIIADHAKSAGHGPNLGSFDWSDPFRLEDQLTMDERMLRDAAREFSQTRLQPRVVDAYREETTDPAIFAEMGEAGLLGITIPEEFGGLGAGYVTYGLVAREVERVDSGYRSMMSVQSSLVMYPIHAYGSPEQQRKYLPGLAAGTLIGCFGLTEPEAGSDPSGMKTVARKTADGYVINGAKMWISNAPIADVFVVWAKSDAHGGKIRGFVLDKGMPGLTAPKIGGETILAGLGHRRDRDERSRRGRGRAVAGGRGAERPVWLPEPRPLWHQLGRDGGSRGLLARRPPIWAGPAAIRAAFGTDPIVPEKAGRHADRDIAGSAGITATGADDRKWHRRTGTDQPDEA